MSRRSHAGAGSSDTPEHEPLLGSEDASFDGDAVKKYASVDVRTVALVDNDDPETECEWSLSTCFDSSCIADLDGGSGRCANAETKTRSGSHCVASRLTGELTRSNGFRLDKHRVADLQPGYRNWVRQATLEGYRRD